MAGLLEARRAGGRVRTFSINLDENVFHCHDTRCGKQGDAVPKLSSRLTREEALKAEAP
jgi:hypothetical protein